MHDVWQLELAQLPDAAIVMKPEDIYANPKLLLEQDPEFTEYTKDVLLKTILQNPDAKQMIITFHSFYNAGMSSADVAAWHRNILLASYSPEGSED